MMEHQEKVEAHEQVCIHTVQLRRILLCLRLFMLAFSCASRSVRLDLSDHGGNAREADQESGFGGRVRTG